MPVRKYIVFLLMMMFLPVAFGWLPQFSYFNLDKAGTGLENETGGQFDLTGNIPTVFPAFKIGAGGDYERDDEDHAIYNGSEAEFLAVRNIDLWYKPEAAAASGELVGFYDRSNPTNTRLTLFMEGSEPQTVRAQLRTNVTVIWDVQTTTTYPAGGDIHIILTWGTGGVSLHVNNTEEDTDASTAVMDFQVDTMTVGGGLVSQAFVDGVIDNVFISNERYTAANKTASWNGSNGRNLSAEVAPPTPFGLSNINVTTAINAGNQTIWDTDPGTACQIRRLLTAVFNTTENATCAIAVSDQNFTTMNNTDSTTQCPQVSSQSHSCTMPSSQVIAEGNDLVYIACNVDENATATFVGKVFNEYRLNGSIERPNGGPISNFDINLLFYNANTSKFTTTSNSTGFWEVFTDVSTPTNYSIMARELANVSLRPLVHAPVEAP